MANINFLDIFHNKNQDKDTLISMTNEVIELYGFPCVLRRWVGSQTLLDPLYQDTPSVFDDDESLYERINTHVYVEYNRFNAVLQAYGLGVEAETSIQGTMKLIDAPKEDDLIDIRLPYDNQLYKFRLGSTDIHKDICYSVILNIYHSSERSYESE